MKVLRNFALILAVFLGGTLAVAQSIPTQAQSGTAQAQPGASLTQPRAPVKAIVTDGGTGEVIAGSKITFTTIQVPGAGVTSVNAINTNGVMVGDYAQNINGLGHGYLYSN